MKLKELLLFSMFSVLKSKELFIRFTACAFRKLLSIYVFSYCFLLLFLFVCCFFFFFLSFFFFFFFFLRAGYDPIISVSNHCFLLCW